MARAKVNPARVNQPTNHRVPMILSRRASMPVRSRNDELFFLASFVFVFQCAVHAPRICTENGQNCEGSGHQAIRHETRGLASCAPRASLACHCLFLTQPPMLTPPFPHPGIYFLDTVDSIAPLQFCIPCCTVSYSNLSYDGSWRRCPSSLLAAIYLGTFSECKVKSQILFNLGPCCPGAGRHGSDSVQ